MEDRSHALIAIVFLVVFAVGAVLVAWWMLEPGAVRVPYLLESKTSVAGLGTGSPVQFKGVKIGVVKSIHLDHETHRAIQVRIEVDKDFPLAQGSYATVGANGFLGPNIIDMHPGTGSAIIETSAAHPAHMPLKQGGMAAMMDQAKAIVGEAKQTLESVRSLLSQQNIEQIADTLKNIHRASAQLVEIEADLKPGAKQLPALIAEARATIVQAKHLVVNADRLIAGARASLASIGNAASSTAALTAQLNQQSVPQLNALMSRLGVLSMRLEA
ncbi:MAG: MlaD family protein, partial [Gammaproteobacteria bacterium]